MWKELKISWMMWRVNRLIKQIAKLEKTTPEKIIQDLCNKAL